MSDSSCGLSIDGFLPLANGIAQSIKARCEPHLLCIYLFLTTHDFSLDFPNDDNLLVFKDTGNKTPNGHITGTKCRPDITAAFENDRLYMYHPSIPVIFIVVLTGQGQ